MAKARRIYMTWYSLFAAACVIVGLAARALLSGTEVGIFPPGAGPMELLEVFTTGGVDTELALPVLAGQLLPPTLIGLMLAGIFAATISTADSQILSCSAAVTNDLVPSLGKSYAAIKAATLGVTALALLMTLYGPESVFSLVTLAWATLAAGLGPLMVIRVFNLRINAPVALMTMLGGVAGALYWRFGLGWHNDMYDVLPGMTAGFVIYFIAIRLLRTDGTKAEKA
jgi:sodium/proline symporter